MINIKGNFLRETLDSLKLKGEGRSTTIANAKSIVQKIVDAYEKNVGKGLLSKKGKKRALQKPPRKGVGPTGLVYGRIQSGKTRAMIASTALAFDNGFRIAVVMTSNSNDLVSQTHLDFNDLKGVTVLNKDEELDKKVQTVKLDMEKFERCILVVTSKGDKSLPNITNFLTKVEAHLYPTLIIDDEGDQASLDTNTYKRSSTGDLTLKPSTINREIVKLRKSLPSSVYISVTGTPQAVLLQSASSDNRPSFVDLLPPGKGYIGGDYFFHTEEPDQNDYKLISLVPPGEQAKLLNRRQDMPEGLKNSILFFLLSASAAKINNGLPDKGYQYLCHPSLKNNEQSRAEDRISTFLNKVKSALAPGNAYETDIEDALVVQYNELKAQLGSRKTPGLQALKVVIERELFQTKILVINFRNNKRHGIEYGQSFNILIGGNTLGRGIAIPNLLVTYYVRSARSSQMDTIHQHARMFGYRKKTLPYTRLFTTRDLYYRFRDIHYSDSGLRHFIQQHISSFPNAFPVEVSYGLKATRKGVLDVNTTESIYPGMQIYPNYMKLPQAPGAYKKIMKMVDIALNAKNPTERESTGKKGCTISTEEVIKIVSLIKTKSSNSYNNKTIGAVIQKLSQRLSTDFLLKYRKADRTVGENGFLSQGTISGMEQNKGRQNSKPTLWIMSVSVKKNGKPGNNEVFAFPTIIVPNRLPKVFVFSKK